MNPDAEHAVGPTHRARAAGGRFPKTGIVGSVGGEKTAPAPSSVLRWAALCTAFFIALGVTASALAADGESIAVVEADSAILKAPTPFPFAGRRIRFVPSTQGGYSTRIEAADDVSPRGKWLQFTPGAEGRATSIRVELNRPVTLFGQAHREIFIHPDGVVTFSEALPAESVARAADSGDLLRALTTGPAFVAALWNELSPDQAPPGGGVYVAQWPDRVMVTWAQVPSVRPAGEPNNFRIVLHNDGRIDLEYGEMHTAWGVVGLSPANRERVIVADLATAPAIPASDAVTSWYRDLPVLDEIELTRKVMNQIPDRFDFMTVFTTQPVDGQHLIGSTTVKNQVQGIGLPVYDHGELFGSRQLEHIVLMNDLAFYADDPRDPPRANSYSYAASTLTVLAHETGHRWLSHLHGPAPLSPGDGHWSFYLESGGSLMGGHRMRVNPDGSFTTVRAMTGFGPLDLYLMGLLSPDSVQPFYLVEQVSEVWFAGGARQPAPTPYSRPRTGATFSGSRRDIGVADVIAAAGQRIPAAGQAPNDFRMAFVLVVPPGGSASAAEIAKVDRIRRSFGPFFHRATAGRARMQTRILKLDPEIAATPAPSPILDRARTGQPLILDVSVHPTPDGRDTMVLDFADLDSDVVTLELSTDASADVAAASIDVTPDVYGARRGSISFLLAELPEGAAELRLALVDAAGRRSATSVYTIPQRTP